MNKKKTICLITDWYPTKENPFRGLFFKEQAFAVSDYFDFLVIRYVEHAKKKIWSREKVELINTEKNTIEYAVDVYVPLWMYLWDAIYDLKVKHVDKKVIDGVGRYVSNVRRSFTRRTIVKVFQQYFAGEFDALYCIDAQKEAFYLQCVAEYFQKPYIVSEHAPVPWPGDIITDINKFAIEKADIFLAISQDKIRQMLLQNIKLPKINYIGNLIDEERLFARERHNQVKTFVIVAAHSFYKNYDLFIAVMNRLTEITAIPFKVMIVGYGANKGYSKNVEEFEYTIEKTKFADKTEMIPYVPHEKIGEVLNRADVFVMTSIQEGQPVSAMEAACCGLPIFSTRCGGVEDYVDDKMGRIYDIMDCEGLANGLKDYLEGKMFFDSKSIRKTIVCRFGKKFFIDKFVNVFNEVIDDDKFEHCCNNI